MPFISTTRIVSRETYQTFISFMFAAAMITWGTTLLRLLLGLSSSLINLGEGSDTNSQTIALPLSVFLAGGILYGGVLICFYWIFIEHISSNHMPTNLPLLVLDFVALTFMTGAAGAWMHVRIFNSLSLITLILLVVRFAVPATSEIKDFRNKGINPKRMIMTHIICVYVLCFIFLAGLLFSHRHALASISFHRDLYFFLAIGMSCGIVVTGYHSVRYSSITPPIVERLIQADDVMPRLVPAYGLVPESGIPAVSRQVFLGEQLFRQLLRDVDPRWSAPNQFHLSRVHSYRDVETQAFIMAHSGHDDSEVKLRSMWVYLAHWFDDLFDYKHPIHIAALLHDNFVVLEILDKLDGRLSDVWRSALKETQKHNVNWNSNSERLLDFGMRRLLLGGPMFSDSCSRQSTEFMKMHKALILSSINTDHGLKAFIEGINERHLAHTAKVVVELWDSFDKDPDLNVSILMNLFYAPGLLYHDLEDEIRHNEVTRAKQEDKTGSLEKTLDLVLDRLKQLPASKLELAMRPVPMFVAAFEPMFSSYGLHMKYSNFLNENKIKEALGLAGHTPN